MNEQLQKRLEEAAKDYADNIATTEERGWLDRSDIYAISKDAHLAGAEHGYKEATAQAREWLKWNAQPKYIYIEGEGMFIDNAKLLADFESDMNKLWEEKK